MKIKKLTLATLKDTHDAQEVALTLGVTVQRVSAMIAAGQLIAVRIGPRRMRITRASLAACIADRQRRGIMSAAE